MNIFIKKSNIQEKEIEATESKSNKFVIKNNKKFPILCAIAIVILIIIISQIALSNYGVKSKDYTLLEKGNNINKIDVKGEVKTEEPTSVYSTVSNQVKEIKVVVGDKVKEGDVLAILDTTNLEKEINELEATIITAEANDKIQLSNTESIYENTYKFSEDNSNAEIANSSTALEKAKINLVDTERVYEHNKELCISGAIPQEELNKSQTDFNNAKLECDNATAALENIKSKVQLDLTTAKNNYEAAKIKADDKSQRISLENKKKQLEESVIKAPINGVISAKIAVVGNAAQGELFEMKNMDNINITVKIKEGDVNKVKVGQEAEIKTDATGDLMIKGEVISVQQIAKVKSEDPLQLSDTSNDDEAEFEAKIKIKEPNENIKLGMKARVNIIVAKNNDVFTVPCSCIVKNGDDKSIYMAEKQDKKYIVKQISVTLGSESDTEVEISGEGINEGVIVLNKPSDYEVGSFIKIKND